MIIRSKVHLKNSPHSISPPPTAGYCADKWQVGSMHSCCLCQIMPPLSVRLNKSGQDIQSSTVLVWLACVHCVLRFLFLSNRSAIQWGLLLFEVTQAWTGSALWDAFCSTHCGECSSSNQFGHTLLTSLSNTSTVAQWTFLLCWCFCTNVSELWRLECMKIPGDQHFYKCLNQSISHRQSSHSRSHQAALSSIWLFSE